MPEPTLTTLTLSEVERDVVERSLVTAAPSFGRQDRDIALTVWERVSKDTVVIDGCVGCVDTYDGSIHFKRVFRDCPVHGNGAC